jgi:hypothetical protein
MAEAVPGGPGVRRVVLQVAGAVVSARLRRECFLSSAIENNSCVASIALLGSIELSRWLANAYRRGRGSCVWRAHIEPASGCSADEALCAPSPRAVDVEHVTRASLDPVAQPPPTRRTSNQFVDSRSSKVRTISKVREIDWTSVSIDTLSSIPWTRRASSRATLRGMNP